MKALKMWHEEQDFGFTRAILWGLPKWAIMNTHPVIIICHKAYSAHNDPIILRWLYTIKYVNDMIGNNLKLYTFVDNLDVERIYEINNQHI